MKVPPPPRDLIPALLGACLLTWLFGHLANGTLW